MTAAPWTSINESLRIGGQVTKTLLKNPNIATVTQKAGHAESSSETRGTNSSELDLVRRNPEVVGALMFDVNY